MDNSESIKALDKLHQKLQRLNRIEETGNCNGDIKSMMMNIVHEAISEHESNKATFNYLLRVHSKSLCANRRVFDEQFLVWLYSFVLFVYSLYGMFALWMARINVSHLKNVLLIVYFRIFFWGIFCYNMYHHAPLDKYWSGEYGLWGLAWAIFDECGFTKIDYSSYAFYEQFVHSFSSADSNKTFLNARADRIPDKDLQSTLELLRQQSSYKKTEEKEKANEKAKEKSKSWQEILYQCCILGKLLLKLSFILNFPPIFPARFALLEK